ncbi:MAG: hypothetical protein GXO77_03060 [Calditrichaeota bacterium]|nr:hypothetical protein [Calditrichota bacterium]
MRKRWIKYWRHDSFLTRNGTILQYDKLEHSIIAFGGMLITLLYFKPVALQVALFIWLIWNGIGLLWELFQFIVKNNSVEIKDVAANNVGFILAIFVFYALF